MTTETPAPAPEPSSPLPPAGPSQDDRTWGMLAHLVAIVSHLIGPLVIYLVKKDQSEYVTYHAKESLNFQIMWLIIYVVVGVVTCGVGLIALPVAVVVNLVFTIMAGIAANNGERYRYPFSIRFIK